MINNKQGVPLVRLSTKSDPHVRTKANMIQINHLKDLHFVFNISQSIHYMDTSTTHQRHLPFIPMHCIKNISTVGRGNSRPLRGAITTPPAACTGLGTCNSWAPWEAIGTPLAAPPEEPDKGHLTQLASLASLKKCFHLLRSLWSRCITKATTAMNTTSVHLQPTQWISTTM